MEEQKDREGKGEESRLYLLPLEDGSTGIVYLFGKQVNLVTYPLEAEDLEEDDGVQPQDLRQNIRDYSSYFTHEYRLKVSLFKEMCRSLPPWAVNKEYAWLQNILYMSTNGELPDPKEELTADLQVLLKWLLFTINDPKLILLPQKCLCTLLENVESGGLVPTAGFLLEHKDGRLGGESATGFLFPSPDEVFSLVYLFPEAAKGRCFAPSPKAALQRLTSRQAFTLAGITHHRYRILIMLEYLLHPGIHCVDKSCGDTICQTKTEPSTSTIYKIIETQNVRPIAILLYKVPVVLKKCSIGNYFHSKLKLNSLVMITLISICILGHALFKSNRA